MIGSFALAFCLLSSFVPRVAAAAPPGATEPPSRPDLRSNAFYILDEADSSVLAARHEHVPVPIASITKLMTALVVTEARLPLD